MARVLVVDDEKSIRTTIQFFLQDDGHEVLTADSIDNALELLKQHEFDIVVTDIILPRKSGTELFLDIRKNYPHLKVIFMTGEPTLETATIAIQHGVSDYIAKPVDEEKICNAVSSAEKAKNLEDENRRLEAENRKHQEHLEKLVKERTRELQESEERLSFALEAANDGMWDWDLRANRAFFSPRYYSMLGYQPDEFPADYDNWLSRLHPEDKERANQVLQESLTTGTAFAVEFRLRRKDGNYHWVLSKGKVVLWDEEGKPIRIAGTHVDIAEQKRAELEAKNRELFLNRILDQSPFATWISDEKGVMVRANKALKDILQLSDEDLIGKYSILEDPMVKDNEYSELIESVFSEGKTVTLELRWSGTATKSMNLEMANPVDVQATIFPVFDSQGKLTNTVCNWIDITNRVKAERELKKSERKYRMLLENLPQKIFAKDLNSVFLSCNTNFAKDLSINPDEIVGKTDYDFFPQKLAEKYRRDDLLVIKSGKMIEFEEAYKVGGEEIIVKTIKFPTKDEQGTISGIQGIFWDITAQRNAEKEAKKLEEQLQQASKMESVGRLAGGIAHDFNNLITSIAGNIELALMEKNIDDPIYETLDEIGIAARRAGNLTKQLLAFSRNQVIQPIIFDLNELVRDIREMLKRLIGEDIEFQINYKNNLMAIMADPGQVEQILVNLAVNARDSMPGRGKLMIETDNVFLDEEYCSDYPKLTPGPYVLLAVSDNGEGMDEETQKLVFEPFFTTKETGKGTGLGLSTVYGIVKKHKGHIRIYSELASGTTFKIYFPQAESKAMPIEKGEAPKILPEGDETILVVEDENMVRKIAARALKRQGFDVLLATDGSDALDLVRKNQVSIDLLLTDVIMPNMNGPELANILKEANPAMKVLFTSGYTANVIAQQGILDEELEFIGKPYSLTSLVQKVRDVLDS